MPMPKLMKSKANAYATDPKSKTNANAYTKPMQNRLNMQAMSFHQFYQSKYNVASSMLPKQNVLCGIPTTSTAK
eukprot:10646426-Karenia_brevis.AAC.1